MKLLNLIKCEFIKNFSIKKSIIILLVLIISCFGLFKFESLFGDSRTYSGELSLKEFELNYKKAEEELNKNNNHANESIYTYFNELEDYYKKTYNLVGSEGLVVWQKETLESLESIIIEKNALEQLIKNYNNQEFKKWIEDNKNSNYDDYSYILYTNAFSNYKSLLIINSNNSIEELTTKLNTDKEIIELYKKSIDENAYYISLEAKLKEINNNDIGINIDELIEAYNYIIENKIKDNNDYRVINAIQYTQRKVLYQNQLPSKEDFDNDTYYYGASIKKYEDLKKYISNINKIGLNDSKIIEYAFKKGIKHDSKLSSDINDNIMNRYISSKRYMNLGLHLGIIIIILMVIKNAGIVSKEQDKGTVKLLLTKPVKRSKILLAKILYLILDMYLIWVLASIMMFIIVGFKYGFNDLFTPKLIVIGGNVKEFNYILWYLKELFICSIPVCCVLVMLFSLSTITLSTSLTATLISIVSVFSISIWMIISNMGAIFLKFLCYTPIPYIDYYFVRYRSIYYLQTISSTNLNYNYGLIISLIVGIILYIITVIIYNKRDIKN